MRGEIPLLGIVIILCRMDFIFFLTESVLPLPLLISVSVTGSAGIGLPIVLLHDSEGAIVTVETKSGDMYRGILDEAEDSMNLALKDVLRTDIHGKATRLTKVRYMCIM